MRVIKIFVFVLLVALVADLVAYVYVMIFENRSVESFIGTYKDPYGKYSFVLYENGTHQEIDNPSSVGRWKGERNLFLQQFIAVERGGAYQMYRPVPGGLKRQSDPYLMLNKPPLYKKRYEELKEIIIYRKQ